MIIEMAPRGTVVERVRCVREQLEEICALMAAPRAGDLKRCSEMLAEAVERMGSIEEMAISEREGPRLRAEVDKLRGQLRVISLLIEQGSYFTREWARMIGLATNGYGRDGEPHVYSPVARVKVMG